MWRTRSAPVRFSTNAFNTPFKPYGINCRPFPCCSASSLHFRFFSAPTVRELEDFERRANEQPDDANAQLAFYRKLMVGYPDLVKERIESKQFASSPEISREYLKTSLMLSNPNMSYEQASITVDQATPLASIPIEVKIPPPPKDPYAFLRSLLGISVFVAIGLFAYYSLQGGMPQNILGGKYEKVPVTSTDTTFDDVKGCDEAKADLKEVVEFLKNPSKFTKLGGKLPKGVLLTGPPGTGKTLMARAVAGEAEVPFFYASGSEFEEMFVGVGAKRIRTLFKEAIATAPCIIFIDEIDAVGGTRQLKEQQAMRMTLNQLLVELDGFESNNGVIVMGATNFPDLLDPALIRPGRFDRQVVVPLPDVQGRKAILDHYLSRIQCDPAIDSMELARGTPGCSGADLMNLINVAAIEAALRGAPFVTTELLDFAKDKVFMGTERKSAVLSEETKRSTAYHEGGHALVALYTDGAMPIHKATIIPRGQALGMVQQLPDNDQMTRSRKELLAMLDVCMGGRVAEELIFGEENVSTGASSDIQQATRIARNMVMVYGMSEKVGLIDHGSVDPQNLSSETRSAIETEIHGLITQSYLRAKELLLNHRDDLEILAKGLLEYEILTKDEIVNLLKGEQVRA